MNSWQDTVLALCLLAFNLALIPSVIGKHKPRLSTSILTTAFLIPELFVFISLDLWYTFFMVFVNASLWGTLAVQRYMQQRTK